MNNVCLYSTNKQFYVGIVPNGKHSSNRTHSPRKMDATLSPQYTLDNSPSCWENTTGDCHDIWREVKFWSLSLIIPIGFICNSIAFTVFATSWMRNTVPGRYFMGLAIADNLVLCGEFLLWLNTKTTKGSRLGIDFIDHVDALCRLIHMLRYGARVWSSWITVAITIERWLTVTYPLKMASHSSPRKASVVVLVQGVVCFAVCSFPLFTLSLGDYNGAIICRYIEYGPYNICVFVLIAILGELILPSVIVFVFTILIIHQLAKARHERKKFMEGRLVKKSEAQPTKALLAIAIIFVTIRLPYIIAFFVNDLTWTLLKLDAVGRYNSYIAYKITNVLAVFNYAINFLVFCLSGRTFRRELLRCVTCQRRSKRPVFSDDIRSRSTSLERIGHYLRVRSRSLDLLKTGRIQTGSLSKSLEKLTQPQMCVKPLYGISASVDRLDTIRKHGPLHKNNMYIPSPLSLGPQKTTRTPLHELPGDIQYMDAQIG